MKKMKKRGNDTFLRSPNKINPVTVCDASQARTSCSF